MPAVGDWDVRGGVRAWCRFARFLRLALGLLYTNPESIMMRNNWKPGSELKGGLRYCAKRWSCVVIQFHTGHEVRRPKILYPAVSLLYLAQMRCWRTISLIWKYLRGSIAEWGCMSRLGVAAFYDFEMMESTQIVLIEFGKIRLPPELAPNDKQS